jgi:hypothetical protein
MKKAWIFTSTPLRYILMAAQVQGQIYVFTEFVTLYQLQKSCRVEYDVRITMNLCLKEGKAVPSAQLSTTP